MGSGLLLFLTLVSLNIVITRGLLLSDIVNPSPSLSPFECGKPFLEPYSQRIVGGHEARRGAWPWIVELFFKGYPDCAGAIIQERFVLTAAHCFILDKDVESDWIVKAGKLRLDKVEIGEQTLNVSKIYMHEHLDLNDVRHDIALVVLDKPINYSTYVRPICLPGSNDVPKPGEPCLLAGWGQETAFDEGNTVLKQVTLPIIEDDTCGKPTWYGHDFLPETTFCAGYESGGKDACQGDSGAPLICKTNSTWVIKGISSWGIGCGEPRLPGIYTDVNKYLDWIHSKMDNN